MATQTTNLNLTKPAYSEDADVAVINSNMDILDGKIGAVGITSLQAQATANSTSIGKIIPKITTTTNNSGYAIAAGDYFEASGILYKATAAIPKNSAWSSSATAQGDSVHGALNGAFDTLNSKIANLDGSSAYASVDVNNCTTTGIYHVGITSHSPTGSSAYGTLFVEATPGRTTQLFTVWEGNTYVRQYTSNAGWSTWQEFALNSNVTALSNRFSTVTSGSLHDITTPGIYYISSAVTDKPGNPGTYILNTNNDNVITGVYVDAVNGKTYSVQLINSQWTYNELALNSKLTVVSSSMQSVDTSLIYVNTNVMKKYGEVVVFDLQFEFLTMPTVGTEYKIGTMPSGFSIPATNEYSVIGAGSLWQPTDLGTVRIKANSDVTFTPRGTATTNWYKCNISFIRN